jgi:hypothetical protein
MFGLQNEYFLVLCVLMYGVCSFAEVKVNNSIYFTYLSESSKRVRLTVLKCILNVSQYGFLAIGVWSFVNIPKAVGQFRLLFIVYACVLSALFIYTLIKNGGKALTVIKAGDTEQFGGDISDRVIERNRRTHGIKHEIDHWSR